MTEVSCNGIYSRVTYRKKKTPDFSGCRVTLIMHMWYLFKLAVRFRLHAGRAELLRTEIHAVVVVVHLSFFRILKLLCYFGTYTHCAILLLHSF